jgi:hypothetical protein
MALEVKVRHIATGFFCPMRADFAVVMRDGGIG